MRASLKGESVLIHEGKYIKLEDVSIILKIDEERLIKYYSKYIFENEYMNIEGVKVLEPNFNPFKVRIKVAPEGEDPRELKKSKIVPEGDDLRQLLLEYKNSPQYRIDCLMFLKGELDAQMDRALHSEHK